MNRWFFFHRRSPSSFLHAWVDIFWGFHSRRAVWGTVLHEKWRGCWRKFCIEVMISSGRRVASWVDYFVIINAYNINKSKRYRSFLLGNRTQPFGGRCEFGWLLDDGFSHVWVFTSSFTHRMIFHLLFIVFLHHQFVHERIAPFYNFWYFLNLSFFYFFVKGFLVL